MLSFNRITTLLMHGIFLVLMIMAIFLYKERLFADASYYLFHAINKGWFHIEHGRIVLGISQIAPLMASYLGLPLKFILVAASLGHELFYYGLFLLCTYGLKDKIGGIAILSIHLIGQLWLYYSPMLEICYGAALAVAFYSLLKSAKLKDDKWIIFLILIEWFTLTSHPENFLLIGLAITYDFLQRGYQKRLHLIAGGLFIIALLIELLTFSAYESDHTQIIDPENPAGVLNLLNGEYLTEVITVFTSYYLDLIILGLATICMLILQKSRKKILLFLGAIVFLVAIVNQAVLGNEFSRYNESMYNPLVFTVVFFFCYEFLTRKSFQPIALLTLLFICGYRVYWIADFGEPLRNRMAHMERMVDYAQLQGHSKYQINANNVSQDGYAFFNWANPIETLLFTAIDGKEHSLSIATTDEIIGSNQRSKVKLSPSHYLFRQHEIVPNEFLNDRYFSMKEEEYLTLNTAKEISDIPALAKGVSIELLENRSFQKGDSCLLKIIIKNNGPSLIPSALASNVFVSYHWKRNGKDYQWDGLRTPLEMDIHGEYVQYIRLAMPMEEGMYEFVPDLVVEGQGWFGLQKKFNIEITN